MKKLKDIILTIGQMTIIVGGFLVILCVFMSDLVPIPNKLVITGILMCVFAYVVDLEDKVYDLRKLIRKLKRRK